MFKNKHSDSKVQVNFLLCDENVSEKTTTQQRFLKCIVLYSYCKWYL